MKTYKAGFDINTNANEVAEEFDNLSKATDKATESAVKLDAKFEDIYGEMQPLTSRMGEAEDRLYELALAGDTATQEYQQLLNKVGEYRKVQIKTDLAVDAAATTMGQKLGGALQGATGGFSAVQGVMGLVGGESEQLEKALLKVQSAMAIQQGIQGMRESLPMLKQMGGVAKKAFAGMTQGAKAFAMTGIGVVLTAVAALAYALNALEEAEKKAEEVRQKTHDDTMARYDERLKAARKAESQVNKVLDEQQVAREQQVKLLQAQGKSITEAEWEVAQGFMENINTKGKALQDRYHELQKDTTDNYKKLGKQFRDTFSTDKQYLAEQKAAYKLADARKVANKKEQVEVAKQIQALRDLKATQFDSMEVLEAQHLMRSADKRKAYRDERLKAERLIIDLNNATQEEGQRKDIIISNENFKRKIEDLKLTKFTAEEKARLTNLYLTQQFDEEAKIRKRYRDEALAKDKAALQELSDFIKTLREKQEAEEVAAMDRLNQITNDSMHRQAVERLGANAVEIAQTNAKYDELVRLAIKHGKTTHFIEKERAAALVAIEKTKNDKIKADNKAQLDARLQMTNDAFGAISGLITALAKDNEVSQKRAFKVNKAISIAQAVINTAGAITAAINPAVGGLGIPAGLPGAAIAAATGIAQVATIAKTEYQSTAVDSIETPSASGGAAISPEFNVVGDSGINQIAQLQQAPIQAYVVSGEVTTGQALDRNRVENATL